MHLSRLLTDYLAQSHGRPFDWAGRNCCHFAARWVAKVTGRDPMAALPVTENAYQAVRLVARLGGMQQAWTQQMGAPAMPPAQARVGDVVLLPGACGSLGTGYVLGICVGGTAVAATQAGDYIFLPMREAVAAWRVEVPA